MMEQRAIGTEMLTEKSDGGAAGLARDREDEGRDGSSICCATRRTIAHADPDQGHLEA